MDSAQKVPAAAPSVFDVACETEFDSQLIALHLFEPAESNARRSHVVERLDMLVAGVAAAIGAEKGVTTAEAAAAGSKVLAFGSYREGVHGPQSDLDLIAICPAFVSREEFFVLMAAVLSNDEDGEFKPAFVKALPDAYVPVLKMAMGGFMVDLLFARLPLPRLPPLLLQATAAPALPPPVVRRRSPVGPSAAGVSASVTSSAVLSASSASSASSAPPPTSPTSAQILSVLDDALVRRIADEGDPKSAVALNGVRVTEKILSLVPAADQQSFQYVLVAVKSWAKARGIYGHMHGYPGGVTWAIIVATITRAKPGRPPLFLLRAVLFALVHYRWGPATPWKLDAAVPFAAIGGSGAGPKAVSLRKTLTSQPAAVEGSVTSAPAPLVGKSASGPVAAMVVLTPVAPSMNTSHFVTARALELLQQEALRLLKHLRPLFAQTYAPPAPPPAPVLASAVPAIKDPECVETIGAEAARNSVSAPPRSLGPALPLKAAAVRELVWRALWSMLHIDQFEYRYRHYFVVTVAASATTDAPLVLNRLASDSEAWFGWVESRLRVLGLALSKVQGPERSAKEGLGGLVRSAQVHLCPMRWVSGARIGSDPTGMVAGSARVSASLSPRKRRAGDSATQLLVGSDAGSTAPSSASNGANKLQIAEKAGRFIARHFLLGVEPVAAVSPGLMAKVGSSSAVSSAGESEQAARGSEPESPSLQVADATDGETCVRIDYTEAIQSWLRAVWAWVADPTRQDDATAIVPDVSVTYASDGQLRAWLAATGTVPELELLHAQRWDARRKQRSLATDADAGAPLDAHL